MKPYIKSTLVDHMGSDLSVVNAARVSFGKKSQFEGGSHPYYDPLTNILNYKDKKLIKYLAKHKHFSPFGHAFASFHVKAPIFVARQLVKHKFLRWNEISRRYVDNEPEFYIPDVWRGKGANKKQGSEGVINLNAIGLAGKSPTHESDWEASLLESIYEGYSHTLGNYDAMIKAGVAPEMARMTLPQSTMTEWYWSGSLDAFADMYNLRAKPDAQEESRYVAYQIGDKMQELFPESWKELTR
jgi:thymidylate synthase (FAD)